MTSANAATAIIIFIVVHCADSFLPLVNKALQLVCEGSNAYHYCALAAMKNDKNPNKYKDYGLSAARRSASPKHRQRLDESSPFVVLLVDPMNSSRRQDRSGEITRHNLE